MSLDKDGDKKISKDEAPERMKENFAQLDTNTDGFLDSGEIAALRRRCKKCSSESRMAGPRGSWRTGWSAGRRSAGGRWSISVRAILRSMPALARSSCSTVTFER